MDAFKSYIDELNQSLSTHDASEGSHYETLKALIEALYTKVSPNTAAAHQTRRPDFKVSKGSTITIGYIEAKDIGLDLSRRRKRAQGLKRYLALPNILLTDYLEFRWYAEGKLIRKSRLGVLKDNKIKADAAGIQDSANLLDGFLGYQREISRHP